MKEKQIVLYMHAGSGNHGCEAIIHSTCQKLQGKCTLISARKAEDVRYSLASMCQLLQEKKITENIWIHMYYLAKKILTRNPMCYINYRYGEVLQKKKYDLAISVGGDNYCYKEQVQDLILLNKAFERNEIPTILWGASIEEELLKRSDVIQDMNRYQAIFARERQTYQALLRAGIPKEKVYQYPDPAFTLESVEKPFPEGMKEGNIVGINISPMVIQNEKQAGIVFENYQYMIEQLLEHTDMQIALIPHVIWDSNDDRKPLSRLYQMFQDTGRVFLLQDADCMTLKGYVKRMRFLVAARTHVSIAAYSTCVPTLVTGYSVKAKGIAEDLFGTQEHYVLPVQQMTNKENLWRECVWLMEHEEQIRDILKKEMPGYIEKAEQAFERLNQL